MKYNMCMWGKKDDIMLRDFLASSLHEINTKRHGIRRYETII